MRPPGPPLDAELKKIFSSGEVISPDDADIHPLFMRHLAAYRFCIPYCVGQKVLDVGSGEGYGSYLLSEVAAEVTGVEFNKALVRYAQTRYGHPRLHFQQGDAGALRFAVHTFDVAVSLQVMEHIPDYLRYLYEIHRVLKPGGLAIIITPNRKTMLASINPYHFKEFSPQEFDRALSKVFRHYELRGLYGSPAYLKLKEAEQRYAKKILALDPLRLRRILPRPLLGVFYRLGFFLVNRKTDRREKALETPITEADFYVERGDMDQALELIGIGRKEEG